MTKGCLVHRNVNSIRNYYVSLCYDVMCDIREKHNSVICNKDRSDKKLVENLIKQSDEVRTETIHI